MLFDELNLDNKILNAIRSSNYNNTTAIQKEVIPHILKRRDVQAIAPTGSGKTAAFVLPILNNIIKNDLKTWIYSSFNNSTN